MNIGRLNKVIYLVKKDIIVNNRGFKEEVYTDIKTIRANIRDLTSREVITAEKLNVINAKKVVIRATDIDETYLIRYKSKIYEIKSMNLLDNERYIEFLIQNVKDST